MILILFLKNAKLFSERGEGVGQKSKFSENSTYHLLLFFTPTFVKDYLLLLQVETKAATVEAKNVMI